MPALYIANASKQPHDFIYWVPESATPRRQRIPAGGQIRVYKDEIAMELVNSIVSQHQRYGMVRANEIDRTKPFVGLCYDVDRPVKVDKIMYADEHNAGVLQEASAEARKLSAGALHDAITRATEGTPLTLQNLDLEVVEQNGPTEAGINEVVTVSREASQAPVRVRTRRNR